MITKEEVVSKFEKSIFDKSAGRPNPTADPNAAASPANLTGNGPQRLFSRKQAESTGRFYSCTDPERSMRLEHSIFNKGWQFCKKWYFIGVNEAAWDQLVEEFQNELIKPYMNAADPIKRLAVDMAQTVCNFLEARAYDPKIPSRAALMQKQTEQLRRQLQNLQPAEVLDSDNEKMCG